MITAQQLLNEARKYIGINESSRTFTALIADYNKVTPHPRGYRVKATDDWCDIFVTVVADRVGAADLIGRECGVERHVDIFKAKGIWRGRIFPKAGDIVVFDWDRNGWSDHIGFVESVQNNTITTIEGNTREAVGRNHFDWSDPRIKGYARPEYASPAEVHKTVDQIAREVIAGQWGNGVHRISKLLAAGYNHFDVQERVNDLLYSETDGLTFGENRLSQALLDQIVELSHKYSILPSFLISVLHLESLWGSSNVARIDNNWAGMTWSGNYVGDPNVVKTKGSARPAVEGGNYIRYASVEDFLSDWVYLFRPDGSYKISGKTRFHEAMMGQFRIGGARYDYAAVGYSQYAKSLIARWEAIRQANPGCLEHLDTEFVKALESKDVVDEKVDSLAKEVILGIWGSYPERKRRLEKAGHKYSQVQSRVNAILKVNGE
ncbi:glucosaminidase domain-containing protein [Aerococcaceae bacterium WGS1372]